MIGNRIVFGNYLQNYDIKATDLNTGKKNSLKTYLNTSFTSRGAPEGSELFVGQKSLKSLRTYQLGVVYGDKYGRETPVLTDSSSSINVPVSSSSETNQLSLIIKNTKPDFADYVRVYVKETSDGMMLKMVTFGYLFLLQKEIK